MLQPKDLPPMSDDVRALNGFDKPPQRPAAASKRGPRVITPLDAGEAPQLGTEAGMHALWQAALVQHGADLPIAVAEYHFFAPWRRWRFDYAFVDQLVAVELDGMAWQAGGGHHNTDADREKQNSAASIGWRVLHFTSKALREDGSACVALLRRALER